MASFSMQHVVSGKGLTKYDPYQPAVGRTMVFQVQCRMCSYEPEDLLHPPRICPKCHSQSWERFARPGSILNNAERYQD
jgi:rRNA maturation endonuclease Nob1